jgi:hypothetical protein
LRPGGRASLDEVLPQVASRVGARTLVLVVSDFMEEPERWGPMLAALRQRRVDLRAFHVYDARELSMDEGDPVRFRSPEDGRRLPVDPRSIREAFQEEVRRYFADIRGILARERAQHLPVAAGADIAEVLAALLAAWPLAGPVGLGGPGFGGGR